MLWFQPALTSRPYPTKSYQGNVRGSHAADLIAGSVTKNVRILKDRFGLSRVEYRRDVHGIRPSRGAISLPRGEP
jgi:hypothetical protein